MCNMKKLFTNRRIYFFSDNSRPSLWARAKVRVACADLQPSAIEQSLQHQRGEAVGANVSRSWRFAPG